MTQFSGQAHGWIKFESGRGKIITKDGQIELASMLSVGMSLEEIADFFTCDLEYLEEQCGPGGPQNELYRYATATYKRAVREAQISLAKDNAAMAKHLGAHALGQPRDPVPDDPNLADAVIGTDPEYAGDPEDWLGKFKPEGQTSSTIEQIKKMTGANSSAAPPKKKARGKSDE